MKKLSILFALVAVLLSTSIGSAGSFSARGSAGAPVFSEDQSVITFEDLGHSETLLIGPYDNSSMFFSLPATWNLVAGGEITLNFSHFLGSGSTSNELANNGNRIGGSLLVFFNGQLIDTILLNKIGENTAVISIPENAYRTEADDGRYDLRLFLDAGTTCEYDDVQSSVLISGASFIDLAYETVAPPTDLKIFPRPFYQADSLIPTSVLLVIPDEPTAQELQAALTVSTGLGSITEGELKVDLVQEKDLTDVVRQGNNLIFVGLAKKFSSLFGAQLPIPVTSRGIKFSGVEKDDGIVEVASSPWDKEKVILVVSGDTDTAVVKAAQAVSTGTLVISGRKDLSVVVTTTSPTLSSTNVFAETVAPADAVPADSVDATSADAAPVDEKNKDDYTFEDLGYETVTMGGYGGNYATFSFYVTAEQAASDEAYLDLLTSHSGLMDLEQTGITVLLNDNLVGGIHFADEGNQVITNRVEILPKILHRGKNYLTIISSLLPFDSCYAPDLTSSWVAISEKSVLHLPAGSTTSIIGKRLDMKNYPHIFTGSDSLEDLAVILAKNEPASWNNASQIVFSLGAEMAIPMVDLTVAYADEVSDEILEEKNLLVLGQASNLPFISDLNTFLPAPFAEGSDEAEQPTLLVNYRILQGVSVGYLQLLPSPWNLDKAILMVMGNTEQGIPMAANALSKNKLALQLTGNFSILYDDQVLSTDTRFGQSKGGLAAELPETAAALDENPLTESVAVPVGTHPKEVKSMPKWILPVFGGSTVVILALLAFLLRRESSSRIRDEESEDDDIEMEMDA